MRRGHWDKILLVLSTGFFLITHTPAQIGNSNSVIGEGRFTPGEGDQLSFIREQLLASAFRDVLTKEMNKLGLESTSFWQHYNQKFDQFFEPTRKKLKEQYGIQPGQKISASKRKKYEQVLRLKHRNLKRNYGNIGRAIGQYSIKKLSRSPTLPHTRSISIQAKVNRNILHQIYLNFTAEAKESNINTLYLTVNFKIENMSWNDMGDALEPTFTTAILERWKKNILESTKSQKLQIQNVIMADKDTHSTLERYIQASSETLDPQYTASLWAKFHFTVERTKEEALFQKREYKIRGDFALINLSNQKIILHQDFSPVKKTYHTASADNLRGQLSGLISGIPLNILKKLPPALKALPSRKSKILLSVSPYRNIRDVLTLMRVLGERGIAHQVSPQLQNYSKIGANILLEYSGDPQKVKSLLSSLNNRHISRHLLVKIHNPQNPFKIALETVAAEPANSNKTSLNRDG